MRKDVCSLSSSCGVLAFLLDPLEWYSRRAGCVRVVIMAVAVLVSMEVDVDAGVGVVSLGSNIPYELE